MKTILAAAAIALSLTTIASAGSRNEALGYALAVVYDGKCAALPTDFMGVTRFGLGNQSLEDISAAQKTIQGVLDKVGLKGFCDRSKPIVDKGVAQVNQVLNGANK